MLLGVLVRAHGRDIQREDVLYALRQPGRAVAELLVAGEVGDDLPLQLQTLLPTAFIMFSSTAAQALSSTKRLLI